ncbi:hypothetical protein WP50_16550, partial [Lactiplantibacillus plantarum]
AKIIKTKVVVLIFLGNRGVCKYSDFENRSSVKSEYLQTPRFPRKIRTTTLVLIIFAFVLTPPHQLLYFDLILPYQVLEKQFGRQFEKLITVITCELWYPKTLWEVLILKTDRR